MADRYSRNTKAGTAAVYSIGFHGTERRLSGPDLDRVLRGFDVDLQLLKSHQKGFLFGAAHLTQVEINPLLAHGSLHVLPSLLG